MDKITPKNILDRFSDRLIKKTKDKTKDIEYLICMNKGFEKWLQCELVLAFTQESNFYPVIYDKKNKLPIKDRYNEIVCDIGVEYNIGSKLKTPVDVVIAETPFIKDYINPKTWIINADNMQKLMDQYTTTTNCHYIELKVRNWINLKGHSKNVSDIMIEDMEKLYNVFKNKGNRDKYHPCSIISLCCVGFYRSLSKTIEPIDIEDRIGKIQKTITQYFEDKNVTGVKFEKKKINTYIYLLMAYYEFK